MTKKTNSLLFRLGINSLWRKKISSSSKVFNINRIEKFIYNELQKYKLISLSLKWKKETIYIQTLSGWDISKYLKKKILLHYKKTRNIKNLAQQYNLNHYYLLDILNAMRVVYKNFYKQTNKFATFYIYKKKKKVSSFLNLLYQSNLFDWTKLVKLVNYSNGKVNKIIFYDMKFVNSFSCSTFQKLKKINGLLYFKFLNVFIENIIFRWTNCNIKVNINNIWCNYGLIMNYTLNKDYFLRLLLLSCTYNNSIILSNYIAHQLKKNKKHKKILKNLTRVIWIFWKNIKIGLRGLQVKVSGKLDGKMRKSKYNYKIGKVQLQTLETFLNYSLAVSYTRFGVISIKLWIVHGNKKI